MLNYQLKTFWVIRITYQEFNYSKISKVLCTIFMLTEYVAISI